MWEDPLKSGSQSPPSPTPLPCQACLTPDRMAVACEDESLSYAHFCSVAWDLASVIGRSAAPTVHVAVCIPKGVWLPVTWCPPPDPEP